VPPGRELSDSQFHNLGVGWTKTKTFADRPGWVTKKVEDTGAFKTPTLRDVARHAPYMHDGSQADLKRSCPLRQGGIRNPH